MSPSSTIPGTPSRLGPRSRTVSRVSSRAPSPPRSPLPTTLRHVASFSSNSRRGSTAANMPPMPTMQSPSPQPVPPHLTVGTPDLASDRESSGSSGINIEVGEGILVKDADNEAEVGSGDDGEAVGFIEAPAGGDDDIRRGLREQLRRTLNQKHNSSSSADQAMPSAKSQGKQPMPVEELQVRPKDTRKPRQYFILTDAGKPVFCSSPLSEDSDALASTMGLMQALISVFIDDGDKLRYISAGNTRISFLLRSPLYFACVSDWGEPESVTRSHLEYLHLQILSVVSGAQLRRIFEKRTNFDLRRLLSGAETFLHTLLARLETDLAISTSSLACLPLDPALRSKAASALIPSKMKDILYVMLVARGRVVTLVRPKKHSVHPADLHILINTIHAPAVFEAPASWLPICLPRFNPSGFLHAYVCFPRQGDLVVPEPLEKAGAVSGTKGAGRVTGGLPPTEALLAFPAVPTEQSTSDVSRASGELPQREPGTTSSPVNGGDLLKGRIGIGLVCVSGGGDFETIRGWCDNVTKTLEESGTLDAIQKSIRRGLTDYSAASLGIAGLRHFVYKNRAHVQVTYPAWDEEYASPEARRRLITLYQTLHDAIHGRSGQQETLKLQYIRTERESVMGWITQPFELYVSISPLLPKSAVVSAANAVVKWVKREEGRLFLRDAPVF